MSFRSYVGRGDNLNLEERTELYLVPVKLSSCVRSYLGFTSAHRACVCLLSSLAVLKLCDLGVKWRLSIVLVSVLSPILRLEFNLI